MEFDTLLRAPTQVSFAAGTLTEDASIGFVGIKDGAALLITDRSPFHPLSLSWPDQPGDRGWLTTAEGQRVVIRDSHEALLHTATGQLFTDDDARAQRRGDPDLRSVVLHLLEAAPPPDLAPGARVTLQVDPDYRAALSLQHSGVHLAALALNQVAAAFWTKDQSDLDSLGHPDFDKSAVVRSSIITDQSTDTYRIGKSLRKKGFDRDGFLSDLEARERLVNAGLCAMLTGPAGVTITPGSGPLDDRRLWSTRLQGATATMFCGGTHVADLSRIAEIRVNLTPCEDGFVMVTQSRAR